MQTKRTTTATWTPVAPVHVIKKRHGQGKKPYKTSIHGKPYSVYWDPKRDDACVVSDICTHRGASLANGTVTDNGCITCQYHGHPTRGNPRFTMTKDNIVWYYDNTFNTKDTRNTHMPPSSWEFGDHRVMTYMRSFPGTNPLLITENQLDWSHLGWVHSFSATKGDPKVTIYGNNIATYDYETHFPGTRLIVENEFNAPWNTCLRFFFSEGENDTHAFSLHFAIVPHDTQNSSVIVRVARKSNDLTGAIGDFVLMASNELPLWEDFMTVRDIDPERSWIDDKLTKDDAFLKKYRECLMIKHPKIADKYGLRVE